MMTIKEQFISEIKERIALQKDLLKRAEDSARIEGSIDALQGLLNSMDTLESEKPMEGLEEEIGAYFKDWYVDESDQGYSLKTPTGSAVMGHMKNVARHFAKWGAENLKK